MKTRQAYFHIETQTWRLPLTKGHEALLDEEDALWAQQWLWYSNTGYPTRNVKCQDGAKRLVRIHQEIVRRMGLPMRETVDHVNGNPLDNRRANLRTCLYRENASNKRRARNNKTGYTGVHWEQWHGRPGRWMVRVAHGGVVYKRRFRTFEEAVTAHREAASKLHGEFYREVGAA